MEEKSISKIKLLIITILSCIIFTCICPITVEASGNWDKAKQSGQSDWWKWWDQLQSSNVLVQNAGCRLTTLTKMLADIGAVDPSNFTPDDYYNWCKDNNKLSNDSGGHLILEKIPNGYGSSAMDYAASKDIQLERVGIIPINMTSDGGVAKAKETIIDNLSKGYYIIVSSGGHQEYIDRTRSNGTDIFVCRTGYSNGYSKNLVCKLEDNNAPNNNFRTYKELWLFKSNTLTPEYTLDHNGTLTISGDGKITKEIKKKINKSIVQKIIIRGNIIGIGESAFSSFENLKSVTIGDSVIDIGESAFDHCRKLENVTIGNSVKTIGKYAFFSCYGINNVSIPNSVITIGESAFSYCTALNTIVIPDSVTSVGEGAFMGCTNLNNATIGRSMKEIPVSAFSGCENLTNVTIPNSVTKIGDYAFSECKFPTISIPNSVTTIGERAFSDCVFANIIIPDSVTSIGESAFTSCDNLASITIPNSVTYIGNSAFWGTALQSITVPDSVTEMGDFVFFGCKNLKKVILGNSIPTIGEGAFRWCESLTSIYIPDSVTTIGYGAFMGCDALTSVTIPNSVKSLGESAFSGCISLSSVLASEKLLASTDLNKCFSKTPWKKNYGTVSKKGTNFVDSISGAIYVVLSNTTNSPAVKYSMATNTNATSISVASTVKINGLTYTITEIGSKAFKNNKKVKIIKLSKSITKIGNEALLGCTKLTSLTIGANVSEVGNKTFYNCSSLTSITLPANTTKLGKQFAGKCPKLKTLTIKSTKLTKNSIVNGAFKGIGKNVVVKVPKSKVKEYKKLFQSKGLNKKVKVQAIGGGGGVR